MMPLRNLIAIATGKFAGAFAYFLWSNNIFKYTSGSSLPGKLALKLSPDVLPFLGKQVQNTLVVTGTNGKSTTTGLAHAMLSACLQQRVIHNPLGANMKTGITTSLLKECNYWGKMQCHTATHEIDEGSLPIIAPYIQQQWTVVTNLFRDQLDRYGELDTTAQLIGNGIEKSINSGLILNADDPLVTNIANRFKNTKTRPVKFFGFAESVLSKKDDDSNNFHNQLINTVQIPSEVTDCPLCQGKLIYTHINYGHLGHYYCNLCDFKRPETDVTLLDYQFTPGQPTIVKIALGKTQTICVSTTLQGRFNLYNLLAAISGAFIMCGENFNESKIQDALNKYQSIFGRSEVCIVQNKPVVFYLIKNPIGAGEVLKTVQQTPNRQCLITINDMDIDGTDISWLWDAPFEVLSDSTNPVLVSGRRAWDMGLRLQYAGLPPEKIKVIEDPIDALNQLVEQTEIGQTAFILPTYTALLNYSKHLGTR